MDNDKKEKKIQRFILFVCDPGAKELFQKIDSFDICQEAVEALGKQKFYAGVFDLQLRKMIALKEQ